MPLLLSFICAPTNLTAWTGPTAAPPNNNAAEPINISGVQQFKPGIIGANILNIYGASQYLNFGNSTGSGGFGIRNNGGVLEFKNSGGSWAALGSGQWTTTGSNIYFGTGNVGIGSANPGYKLQINGSGAGAGSATISLNEANVRQWLVGAGLTGSGKLSIQNSSTGLDAVTIDGSSNVGIGTTSPAAKLTAGAAAGSANQSYYDIGAGRIAVNESLYSYGRICAGNSAGNCLGSGGVVLESNGNVTAAGYFHNSDARLKDNIATSPGLSVVEALRGVTFDWRKDHSPSAGVIAQEIEEILPSAVRTDEHGIKSVDYDQLIAPLIEAVKEQQAQIRQQHSEIIKLKHAIYTLQTNQ